MWTGVHLGEDEAQWRDTVVNLRGFIEGGESLKETEHYLFKKDRAPLNPVS
jgi:hypothetical protein